MDESLVSASDDALSNSRFEKTSGSIVLVWTAISLVLPCLSGGFQVGVERWGNWYVARDVPAIVGLFLWFALIPIVAPVQWSLGGRRVVAMLGSIFATSMLCTGLWILEPWITQFAFVAVAYFWALQLFARTHWMRLAIWCCLLSITIQLPYGWTDRLQYFVESLSGSAASGFLDVLQIPNLQLGDQLQVEHHKVSVAQVCDYWTSYYLLAILTLAFLVLRRSSFLTSIVVISSAPVWIVIDHTIRLCLSLWLPLKMGVNIETGGGIWIVAIPVFIVIVGSVISFAIGMGHLLAPVSKRSSELAVENAVRALNVFLDFPMDPNPASNLIAIRSNIAVRLLTGLQTFVAIACLTMGIAFGALFMRSIASQVETKNGESLRQDESEIEIDFKNAIDPYVILKSDTQAFVQSSRYRIDHRWHAESENRLGIVSIKSGVDPRYTTAYSLQNQGLMLETSGIEKLSIDDNSHPSIERLNLRDSYSGFSTFALSVNLRPNGKSIDKTWGYVRSSQNNLATLLRDKTNAFRDSMFCVTWIVESEYELSDHEKYLELQRFQRIIEKIRLSHPTNEK